ncbi:hypothetical protein [Demequina litorisediminis]|uniref:Uncharacterized protein n=1 Tax=Demequina litorisediminis TaxID=1849022 RepID=A0ABQ6IDT7_9MICO|nr:hypothetical protein [Demequina litorisediminis]GMA35505.1 hypothetical protein GCM10025876_17090 [Demequina litorisediminis]
MYLAGPFDNGDSPLTYDLASAGVSPEDIQGLQFVYDYDGAGDGFPPGTTFQPNIVMEFDPDGADTAAWEAGEAAVFTNCTTASAESGAVASGNADPACADVDVLEPEDDGDGPTMEKTFVNPDGSEDPSIPARSHQTTTARLAWSTGGVSNVRALTLQDESGTPPGDATALADSLYDTFDLVQIGPIDGSTDPMMQYDAIDAVLISDGNTWTAIGPCGTLDGTIDGTCVGSMPAITLTAEQRATTVGVQVVYIEGDPGSRGGVAPVGEDPVPPAGSGVARSDEESGRTLDLTYQVRDWRRSALPDLEAVDGLDVYNGDGAGVVNNAASATSQFDVGSQTVGDNTNIVIEDIDLDVATTKTWDGSPVGIPPAGTLPVNYPHTAIDLRVTNNSSIVYADEPHHRRPRHAEPTHGRHRGDVRCLRHRVDRQHRPAHGCRRVHADALRRGRGRGPLFRRRRRPHGVDAGADGRRRRIHSCLPRA